MIEIKYIEHNAVYKTFQSDVGALPDKAGGVVHSMKATEHSSILVDTLGLLMMVVVTAANLNDRKGATMLLEKLNEICDQFPRLSAIWVDRGYRRQAFIMAILHTF